jgi:hypothetical protein
MSTDLEAKPLVNVVEKYGRLGIALGLPQADEPLVKILFVTSLFRTMFFLGIYMKISNAYEF